MIRYCYASTDKDGKKGDSSGKEVKVANEYNFGQTKILRPLKNASKIADIAIKLSKNDNIGYSQSRRYGLWDVCVLSKWRLDKVMELLKTKKVDTDCSQYWACCVNLAFGSVIIPKYNTTSVSTKNANASGRFLEMRYKKGCEIKKGDAILKAGKHIAIATTNGKAGV